MDMSGERRIPAPREKVWAALNDPAVLRSCIPGCERLDRESDTDMVAAAGIKIGPISAKFTGRLHLTDLDPPNGYRIMGEGQGGVAGFAKGGATVRLSEDAGDTLLRYDVEAQVGGKIAQLGARLVDATAKQMADAFFSRFVAEVTATPVGATGADGPLVAAAALAGAVESHPAEASGAPAPNTAAPHAAVPSRPVPQPAPLKLGILDLIPAEPFGIPRVAWIGSALYLLIFVLIFSAYL